VRCRLFGRAKRFVVHTDEVQPAAIELLERKVA
jgi:hypothetical protein